MDNCEFKADILKQEIDLLDRRVQHLDDLRHRTKQMAATLWIAAVGTALTLASKPLLWLALFVPVPFWYFDAQYNAYQEGFWRRWWAIRRFIRDGTYTVPAGQPRLDDLLSDSTQCVFPVPDYYGEKTFEEAVHNEHVSLRRNAFTPKMRIFYGGLVVVSLVLIDYFPRLNPGALHSR